MIEPHGIETETGHQLLNGSSIFLGANCQKITQDVLELLFLNWCQDTGWDYANGVKV